MDLHPNMMSKFKANAYGLATSLSKALESVGSKAAAGDTETHNGGDKTLNNNNKQSNYNYSPLLGHDSPACSSPTTSSSSNNNAKRNTDFTPRCMRPKSLSFQEVREEMDPTLDEDQVSSPVLTSSTNPFLPSESTYSTRPFIYNDLQQSGHLPKSPNNKDKAGMMYQEMQEIKPNNKQREYLETNFEGDLSAGDDDKVNYKLHVGVPMVGMVPNAELVKINTQSPKSPVPSQQLFPVAAIHPSQAVPLSSIFGLSAVTLPPQPDLISIETTSTATTLTASQSQLEVNPNSKSTDIF